MTLNWRERSFENGIVYEAYGQDTLLTLAAPLRPSGDPTSRLTTVRLAGNGTINFASGIETGNSTAIKVEQDSTAALLGEDARRLDLIVSQWVQGTDMSAFSDGNTRALIDVTNAGSLTFEGSSAAVDLRDGVAILASDQRIVIGKDTRMRALDSNNDSAAGTQKATLVHMAGDGVVENYGQLIEAGDIGGPGANLNRRSQGVVLAGGGTLHNARTDDRDFGEIDMHGAAAVLTGTKVDTVINDGLLRSRSGAAIVTSELEGAAIVRNNAQGTISGVGIAYEGGDGVDFVVNAGTINGDVNLGGNEDAFLAVADANGNPLGQINGTINGGEGQLDAYGRSFGNSATYTASNSILNGTAGVTGFERHGIEANGPSVIVTFAAAETLVNGLTMFGTGAVVNQADIETHDGNASIIATDYAEGLDFINDLAASVTAEGGSAFYANGTSLSSFTNRGSLAASGGISAVQLWLSFPDDFTFEFVNSGQVLSTDDTAVQAVIDGASDLGANFHLNNSGTIRGGVRGAFVVSQEGTVEVTNSGVIEGGAFGATVTGERILANNVGEIEARALEGGRCSSIPPMSSLRTVDILSLSLAGVRTR